MVDGCYILRSCHSVVPQHVNYYKTEWKLRLDFKQKETPETRPGTNMYSETTTGLHQIKASDKFWHQSSSVIKNVVRETEIYNQNWTNRLEIK